MSDERFPKQLRIKSSEQFSTIINQGSFATDAVLIVNAVANQQGLARIGITIPKKTGGAPVRNHWKRLIREAFRTQKDSIPAGFDFIVRPRRGAEPTFEKVSRSLASLTRRATKPKSPHGHRHSGGPPRMSGGKS